MEMTTHYPENSLRAHLDYAPQPLTFGTSGRRGEVIHLAQLEIYINALADIAYLQSLPAAEGGIRSGADFYFAYDLRPSSTRFVPEQGGRGEIAQAVVQAIMDAGMRPVNLGALPTPALTYYGFQHGCGSIMITGSHIPFDRNGFKTNTANRELLKTDEAPVACKVAEVRERVYRQPFSESAFDARGRFKTGHRELPRENANARRTYLSRYRDFFAGGELAGQRILVYQHSAVGRDLLVEMLQGFGAEVIPAGRSETFVPIDTENINAECLAVIQELLDTATAQHGNIDAVVSTDGDSDRPLVLGVTPEGKARFFGGDLLGMVVAEYLGADAVVVPVSCNDAIDRSALKAVLEPKTRIGSPYVVAGMEKAQAKGRNVVCGWEANGGFLLGSDIARNGNTLAALPTRDAFLPILSVLFAAQERGVTLPERFDTLPKRFSKAALLKNFSRAVSRDIVSRFSPQNPDIQDINLFDTKGLFLSDREGKEIEASDAVLQRLVTMIYDDLAVFFPASKGFGNILGVNYTDGVRIHFDNNDVVHFRPSGNAEELRIYAVADTPERAEEIAAYGVAEPEGILRAMERAVTG